MSKLRFYRHPRFIFAATMVLLLGGFIAYRAFSKTSYELYERIKVGDNFAEIIKRIGRPIGSHRATNGTDFLFSVTGHPDYPRLMGAPFPVHVIIRVQGGRVVSKGEYEDYYDPYSPGWVPKTEETN